MHGDITISFKITMSSYSNHIYCLDYLTKVKENYALYLHTSISVRKTYSFSLSSSALTIVE